MGGSPVHQHRSERSLGNDNYPAHITCDLSREMPELAGLIQSRATKGRAALEPERRLRHGERSRSFS